MELLKSLCLGGVPPSELPHGSAKIIKLYLCNVGFDFAVEGALFTEKIWPKLREHTRQKFGCDVECFNLSDGLSKSFYQEHISAPVLEAQLEKSAFDPLPPLFLVFAGHKFPTPLLPHTVPSRVFHAILGSLRVRRGKLARDMELLTTHYQQIPLTTGLRSQSIGPADEGDFVLQEPLSVRDLRRLEGYSPTGLDSRLDPMSKAEWNETKAKLVQLFRLGIKFCLRNSTLSPEDVALYLPSELDIYRRFFARQSQRGRKVPFVLVTRDILDIRNYLNIERVRDFIDVELSGSFDETSNEKQVQLQQQPVAQGSASAANGSTQQAEKLSATTATGVTAAGAPASASAPLPKPASPAAGKAPIDAHAAIGSGLPTRPRTPHTPTTERQLSTATASGGAQQPLSAQTGDYPNGTKPAAKSAAAAVEEQKATGAESTASIIENARKRFVEHIEGKPGKQSLAACQVDVTLFNAFQRSRNQLEQLCADADAECLSPTRVLWKFPGGIERELHRVYLEDLQRIVFGKLSRLLDAFLEYSEGNGAARVVPDQLVTLYDTVWSNLQFVKKSLDQYPLQDSEAQDAAEQRLLEKLVSGPVPGRPVLLIGSERNLYDEGLIARAFLRLQQTIAGDPQPQQPQSPHSEQQSDRELRDGDGEGRSDSRRPILVVTEVRPQQKMSKCFSTVVWQTRLAAGGFMTQKELLTFSCNSWQSFFAALPSDRRVILVFAHVENFAPPEAFAASSQGKSYVQTLIEELRSLNVPAHVHLLCHANLSDSPALTDVITQEHESPRRRFEHPELGGSGSGSRNGSDAGRRGGGGRDSGPADGGLQLGLELGAGEEDASASPVSAWPNILIAPAASFDRCWARLVEGTLRHHLNRLHSAHIAGSREFLLERRPDFLRLLLRSLKKYNYIDSWLYPLLLGSGVARLHPLNVHSIATLGKMDAVLPRGADEFLNITFDQLEARFGRRLIGSICAYLTISETGLCDLELIDTLSLDDEVLNELQATAGRPDAALVPEAEPGPLSSARPRYRRFPALLWYMLKSEMAGVLLRNAHSNGIKAFTWINDAVANCVWTRYLHGQDLTYFYQHLAALFSGFWHSKPKPVLTGANAQRESPPALDGPIAEASPHAEVAAAAAMNESPSPTPTPHTPRALQLRPADERPPPPPPPAVVDRIVPSQPVVWRFVEDASGTRPPQLRFNLRKIEQLPRHLNLSRQEKQLNEQVLFNYQWLLNKCKAISIESVIDDLHASANRETRLVEFVMRRSQPILEHNLDNLSSELLGYLLPYASTTRPGFSPTPPDASPPPPPAPSAAENAAGSDGHTNPNPNLETASAQRQPSSLSPNSNNANANKSSNSSPNADARFLYPNIKYLLDQCDRELQNNTFIPIFPYSSLSVNYSLLNAVDIRDGTPLTSPSGTSAAAAAASAGAGAGASSPAASESLTQSAVANARASTSASARGANGAVAGPRRATHNLLAEAIELKQHKLDAKVAYDVTFKSPFVPGCETSIVAADGVPDVVVNEQSRVVYVKYANESHVSVYDLQTGALAKRLNSSLGRMFVSAGFERALLVETDTLHSIKVHDLQQSGGQSSAGGAGGGSAGGGGGGAQGGDGDGGGGGGGGGSGQSDLIGEVVPVNVIQPAPLEDRLRFRLECLDVGRTVFVAIIGSTDTSFVCVGNVQTCNVDQIFKLEDRSKAYLCKLSPDEKILFCNSGEKLITYDLTNQCRSISTVELQGKPKKLLVLRDGRRAFLICENETKVVVIVQARGSIDKSYKVVFDHSLRGDLIADMCTGEREELLLIRASRNLLLYDMEHESIRQHWPRPPEIPLEFKLPNSSDYVQLAFSEARFALRDRLVLAAIFRDVLIWSVHNGQPVTMIHAPVGLLNGIVVVAPPHKPDESEQNRSRAQQAAGDSHPSGSGSTRMSANAEQQHEPYLLMGFIGLQNRHMLLTWNLNATVSEDYQSVGHVMDSLTNPISRVCLAAAADEHLDVDAKKQKQRAASSSGASTGTGSGSGSQLEHMAQVAAAVSLRQSDEMGIFDLRTGYLTDLYTHEGKIQDLTLTSSGSYALVSIAGRRPGTSNLAWSLLERRVVAEFEDRPAHFVARRFQDQVFALFARDDAARPYEIQQIDLGASKDSVTTSSDSTSAASLARTVLSFRNAETGATRLESSLAKHVLCGPVVSTCDDQLVWIAAEQFDRRAAAYTGFSLVLMRFDAQKRAAGFDDLRKANEPNRPPTKQYDVRCIRLPELIWPSVADAGGPDAAPESAQIELQSVFELNAVSRPNRELLYHTLMSSKNAMSHQQSNLLAIVYTYSKCKSDWCATGRSPSKMQEAAEAEMVDVEANACAADADEKKEEASGSDEKSRVKVGVMFLELDHQRVILNVRNLFELPAFARPQLTFSDEALHCVDADGHIYDFLALYYAQQSRLSAQNRLSTSSPAREGSLVKEPLSPTSGDLDDDDGAVPEASSPHPPPQLKELSVDVGIVGGVVQVPSLPGARSDEKPRNFCFLLEDSVLVCSVGDRLLACRVRDGRLLGYIHTHSHITSLSKAFCRRSEAAPAGRLGPAELDRVVVCGCADGSLVSYAVMDSESLERRTDTVENVLVPLRTSRRPLLQSDAEEEKGAGDSVQPPPPPAAASTSAHSRTGRKWDRANTREVPSYERPPSVQARPVLRQSSVDSGAAGAGDGAQAANRSVPTVTSASAERNALDSAFPPDSAARASQRGAGLSPATNRTLTKRGEKVVPPPLFPPGTSSARPVSDTAFASGQRDARCSVM